MTPATQRHQARLRVFSNDRRSRARAVGTAALLCALSAGAWAQTAPAPAASGMDWQIGYAVGNRDGVRKLGVIAGWQRPTPLWQGTQWRLALRHELELAYWRVPQAKDIVEAGYSPVLRLERPLAGSHLFFAEASIGVRLLSHPRLSPDRTLSTAFQFSDQLGVGYQWGEGGRSTIGLRYTHLSNGGIKRPNPGINFAQLYYRHRF